MTATITPTDEQIQREVLAELEWDATIRSTEVGVVVKDGVVTLTGWVDSYAKKLAAERAAHRVRGVKAVANEIEVRLPSTTAAPWDRPLKTCWSRTRDPDC
jgi:osmotically-inducible protein OsmY